MADIEYTFEIVPKHELFYSDSSSFGVFSFETKDELPKLEKTVNFGSDENVYVGILSGRMQRLYIGDTYKVIAKLTFNKKYNKYQYEPIKIMSSVPKSSEQQKSFLQSILTENQANVLIENYPNIVEDIMNGQDNVDFAKLKGIGDYTYKRIKDKIINNYVIADILAMLQPLGVTLNTIKKLEEFESNPVLLKKELMTNPYVLTRISGFGFKKVDAFVLKLNPELKVSKHRLRAFINWYLTDIGETIGHTYIDKGVLTTAIKDNVRECYDLMNEFCEEDKQSEKPLLYIKGRKVGLQRYYNTEFQIAQKLIEISSNSPLKVTEENINDGTKEAEEQQGFSLTEEQMNVVLESLDCNACVITAKGGCGKTTSVRTILNIYKQAKYSIACCALSAKAAKVITESTGFEAQTIHRLLGCKGFNKFEYNESNQLPYNVVFVDEGSMISADIFHKLLSAINPKTKLIICGDNRQLPPIGYGNVFDDIISTNLIKVFKFTKVLRQAEKSGILSDANKIRDGINPIAKPELKIVTGELNDMTYMFRDDRDMLNNLAIKAYMGAIKTYGVDNTLIGVPRKKDCVNSTTIINEKIQSLLLADEDKYISYGAKKYKLGAKVIQKVNNYDKDVFNGDIGYIIDIFQEYESGQKVNKFTVEFGEKQVEYLQNEIEQLDLAYAMTIHSLQGSGYKAIVLVIDNTHYALLDNCLLYTALTRAKEKCLLLAEPYAFKRCIETNKTIARQTWIKTISETSWMEIFSEIFKKGIDKE